MLQRLLTVALGAGLATGLLLSILHVFYTTPLILAAEVYENAAGGHEHAAVTGEPMLILAQATPGAEQSHDAAAAEGEGWVPQDGLERTLYTFMATIISAVGFGLMLTAAAVVIQGGLTIRSGLLWGLAGFAATGLATSLSLPPELPGSAAADLALRQAWWIGTAIATAAGIGLVVFRDKAFRLAGIGLVILPHLLAFALPLHPHEYASTVPAELSSLFAARSLVLQGLLWVMLGLTAGWLWQWLAAREAAAQTARRHGIA